MKKETPTVSVIIPNFNHAPYLNERIESVLSQEYQDFELILLDDCSTDNSREILEQYRNHPKVAHVVFNEQNSGSTFAQWSKGLELAHGRYVWIAESDDFAAPDLLKTLVDALDRHQQAVLAFCGSLMVDANGNEIPGMDWDLYKEGMPEEEAYDGDELIRRKLLWTSDIYNASMALFRRMKAPEITASHKKMRYCGDWLFWVRLSRKGGAVEIRRKLNRFRQHNQKVSPEASRSGLYFLEGLPIMELVAEALDLNKGGRRMLAGRLLRRLKKFPELFKRHSEYIRTSLEKLCPESTKYPGRAVAWYELDKFLNLTGLQPSKYKR